MLIYICMLIRAQHAHSPVLLLYRVAYHSSNRAIYLYIHLQHIYISIIIYICVYVCVYVYKAVYMLGCLYFVFPCMDACFLCAFI